MKNVFAVAIILLALISCKDSKNEFSLKGTITGAETGKVYLVRIVEEEPLTVDTADLVDGRFNFKGKMDQPDIRYLRLNEEQYFAPFFLQNSKITVLTHKDSLRNTKILGSPTQDIFQIYINEMERLGKVGESLQQKYQSAMASGNVTEAEKVKIDFDAMMSNNLIYTKNFVKEHSNSVVGAYLTLVQLSNQIEVAELDAIVSGFSPEIATTEYVVKLREMVEKQKKTAIGAVAPDFTMNDPNDKPIQLSNLRGKIVLIDFWASWCAPCRQENPNVVKLYKQYHAKGFEILGVSLDRGREDWIKAIADDQLTWLHVSDLQYWKNAAAGLYGVNSIPQTYLLDKEGIIIAKGLSGESLKNKLAELLP